MIEGADPALLPVSAWHLFGYHQVPGTSSGSYGGVGAEAMPGAVARLRRVLDAA